MPENKEAALTVARLPFHVVVDYVFLFVHFSLSLWSQQLDRGRATDLAKDARRCAGLLGVPVRNFHIPLHSRRQLFPLGVQELAVASSTSTVMHIDK